MTNEIGIESPKATALARIGRWSLGLLPFAASVALVALAALISQLTWGLASASGLTLVFLIAVVISANRFGLWPAVVTSILGVLCWDYFFTLPYYSLRFSDPRDVFALVAFLIVSLIISGMTAQIRGQNARLATLARSITSSYELSQTLSQLATIDELASFVTERVNRMANSPAVLLLIDHSGESGWLKFPLETSLTESDVVAAEHALFPLQHLSGEHQFPAHFSFVPFDGSRGRAGCVGIAGKGASKMAPDERRQLDTFLSQAAIAIERAWLTRDVERTRMIAETERVRNALLTSVSHDLRTPLTAIIGSLSTLRTMGDALTPAIRDELLTTARNEADRLNRFIGNLLDITRLESGSLDVPLRSIDLAEVVVAAAERARDLLTGHVISVDIPDDLPPVKADHALLEQVFFNLLDNAAKYSPSGGTVTVRAATRGERVAAAISDEGMGIPTTAFVRLFQKFSRFDREDTVTPGTGLGLMICRGFLAAMGGTISAKNRDDRRGAIFTIELQCWPD